MATTSWNIDTTHTGINFSVRHMAVSRIRGRFERYRGVLELDEKDLTRSSIEVSIDTASVDTGVPDRDVHLRSADFFDAEKFPELRFRSRDIIKVDDERYSVIGDLTIRDVTREVALSVEYGGRGKDPWGHERAGFIVKAAVDRKDFGVEWNQPLEAGGVLVGDRVDIDIEVELVRLAEQNVA